MTSYFQYPNYLLKYYRAIPILQNLYAEGFKPGIAESDRHIIAAIKWYI